MTAAASTSLDRFHPEVAAWFASRFGEPTEIQRKAWQLVAEGRHCLISAATGSGKTLAAFLWAINQLASGAWEPGQTRALYISPLKALNNDIRRNLLAPLGELEAAFAAKGLDWPLIRVMTRSGDTEQTDRRKMLRKPPEILITTPESLNLLLASKDGQRALLGIQTVILDEIHSVVGGKRGVYLMTAVERLARLNGEFQRVALSATVRPMQTVAALVGGFLDGKPREVALAQSDAAKRYEIAVRLPDDADEDAPDEDFWKPIVAELKRVVAESASTLIFVNSRRQCEKIAYKMNDGEPAPIAYSHHGSLSKEIRASVEQKLKDGELKAIVATNSLEMGIDIGALDRVVMVQCPGSISSAVQKVGRAGHQVGAVSRALLFPSHARDFLESAVMAEAIRERDIEALRPVERPLDVLAQVIVASLGAEDWDLDALFDTIRSAYAYRELSREQFDLVVNMLAGRYAGSRLRELKARIAVDRGANVATLRKGALMAFYFSGGVIPDRGYFRLRKTSDGGLLGELDEEYVWERAVGDALSLGAQSWRIERITYNDVFVSPAASGGSTPPFWRAEQLDRDFHYASKIGAFLEWATERAESKRFEQELGERFALDENAARSLAGFLRSQKTVTRCELPHRHHLVAEIIDAAPSGAPGKQLVLHTQWGGRVNRPFGLALDAAWFEGFGQRTEVYANNDCVVVTLPDEIGIDEILRLVTANNVEEMLRKRLEGSGFFGARFREAAGTSLLITRNKAGQRLPLWLSRLRAKKLFESVRRYDDFPLLLEAWRTCLRDEFDMDALKQVLAEFEQGEIGLSVSKTGVASPFAGSVAWRQINDEYMYATDQPGSDGASSLREDLVRAVAFDAASRPRVPKEVIHAFEEKRQRRAPGYAPSDAIELREWLRDRIVIEGSEWTSLAASVDGFEFPLGRREVACGMAHVFLEEERERVEALFAAEPDIDAFLEVLSYFGPVSSDRLRKLFDLDVASWTALLDALIDERRVVVGPLVEGEEGAYVCEAENFETLLRMNRARNRPSFVALPVSKLGLFLAKWQGLIKRSEGLDGVADALSQMSGYAERAAFWEEDFLPARVSGYQPSWLDSVLLEEGMAWRGAGQGRVGFVFDEDLELAAAGEGEGDGDEALEVALASGGRFSFQALADALETSAADLEERLWKSVWRGRASNDAYAALRRGLLADFAIGRSNAEATRRARPRAGRRPRAAKPAAYPGNWYALPNGEPTEDPVEALELAKERARVLLERYGVVFRELLQREQPGFQWRDVFKALRLMELSGEVLAGSFFEGVGGLQFASKEAFRELRKELPERAIYWLSAIDPASLCGLGLEALKGALPKRLASTRLVYRGAELVLEISRGGKELAFRVAPEDPDLPEMLDALEGLLRRGFNAASRIGLETINGEDARSSPYLDAIAARLRLHRDHKQVVLEG